MVKEVVQASGIVCVFARVQMNESIPVHHKLPCDMRRTHNTAVANTGTALYNEKKQDTTTQRFL